MKVDLFYDEAERVTKFRTLEDEALQFCGKDFTLKAGFVSDGASVPRVLWGICTPLDAKFIRSFLKHDARLPAPPMPERRDRQRAPGRPEGRRNALCGEAFGLHRREDVRRFPLVEPCRRRIVLKAERRESEKILRFFPSRPQESPKGLVYSHRAESKGDPTGDRRVGPPAHRPEGGEAGVRKKS